MSTLAFPQILRAVRLMRNYTQQEMSCKLFITREAYSHYETGQRIPDLETFHKIARILNISSDYLLTGNAFFLTLSNPGVQKFLEAFARLNPELQQKILDYLTEEQPVSL